MPNKHQYEGLMEHSAKPVGPKQQLRRIVSYKMPDDMYQELKIAAMAEGLTIQGYVERALAAFLREVRRRPDALPRYWRNPRPYDPVRSQRLPVELVRVLHDTVERLNQSRKEKITQNSVILTALDRALRAAPKGQKTLQGS
ncbi:hypothetical protein [Oceanithermus sp.]|uniref:hypothetical protein n=1 Tax=Oceanithermus sp. TaxID=2268145 RepID=UPI00257F728F|nr:hypothetical protein [Oceanithermus sp.]